MQKVKKGSFKVFKAGNYRVGVVAAQFNTDIADGLEAGARQVLKKYSVKPQNIKVCKVAGSIEVPVVLRALAQSGNYDCLVALGAVIKGETPHFDYVCKIVTDGVLRVMLDYGIPVGFGVITTNNYEQALARLHSGGEAAAAALQTTKIIKTLN